MTRSLDCYVSESARRHGGRVAVVEPGRGEITYRALDALSDRLCKRLRALGVAQGDRVGIYLRKSIDSVASICGILKAGAAYVPVDPGAPASRNAYILNDCRVAAIVIEERFRDKLAEESAALGAAVPALIAV